MVTPSLERRSGPPVKIVCPRRAGSKVMMCGPGDPPTATMASTNEIPSGPGLVLSTSGFAVFPLVTALVFDTISVDAQTEGGRSNEALIASADKVDRPDGISTWCAA